MRCKRKTKTVKFLSRKQIKSLFRWKREVIKLNRYGSREQIECQKNRLSSACYNNMKFNEINDFPAINKINKKGYKSDGQNFNRITMFLKRGGGE